MIHIQYPTAVLNAAAEMGVELEPSFGYDAEEPIFAFREELLEVDDSDFHGDPQFGISDFHVIQPRWQADPAFEIDDFRILGGALNAHGEADFGLSLGKSLSKAVKTVVKAAPKVVAPKVTLPKIAAPKVTLPKVALPKVTLPKITAPKIVPPKVTPPKVTLPKVTAPKVAAVAFVVPKATPVKTAMAAADKILGDPKVKNPAQILTNTKALAALGSAEAQRAMSVLSAVSQIRAKSATPIGKASIKVQKTLNTAALSAAITPALAKSLAATAVKVKAASTVKPTPVKAAVKAVAKPVAKAAAAASSSVKAAVTPKTSTVNVATTSTVGFWFKVKKFFGLTD